MCPGASYKGTQCAEPQTGKPWCFPSSPMNSKGFPSAANTAASHRPQVSDKTAGCCWTRSTKTRRGSRHLLKAVVPSSSEFFAGQEVNYFEHYNGGNPVSQLQSSDLIKGLFFFKLYLKVNVGWTDSQMENSWLSCHQLCLALGLSTFLTSKVGEYK